MSSVKVSARKEEKAARKWQKLELFRETCTGPRQQATYSDRFRLSEKRTYYL